MRSPGSTFDLRAALADEVRAATDALAKHSSKGAHRCRKRLARARTLARIGHAVAPGLSSVFNDSVYTIMRDVAAAHDLAVLEKSARSLAKHASKNAAVTLTDAANALESARKDMPATDYDAINAGLRDLLALAQVWPEASARQIERGAQRLARRARKAWRKGSKASASGACRQAWRRREMDRLHAAAVLDQAWPARSKARKARNRAVVRLLGKDHDLALLTQRIEATQPAGADPALKALQKKQRRLRRRARKAGAKLHRGRA